jgi:hypothetical protein
MAQIYGTSPIVTDGLVLLLDAADTASYPGSGATWYDLVGKSADGEINGASFNSNLGGYFDFDGVNDYVEVDSINGGTSIFAAGNWTLTIWGYRESTSLAGTSTYSDVFNALGHKFRFFWNPVYGTMIAGYRTDTSSYATLMGSGGTFLGAWHYLTITSDQSDFRYYVDGAAGSTTSYIETMDEYGYWIGGNPWGNSYFYGKIGSVEVYNRALSTSEISQNFKAKRKRFGV